MHRPGWLGFLGILVLSMSSLPAQKEIPLWSSGAPGTEGLEDLEEIVDERIRNVFQPSLTVHLPPRELSTGTSVLVCPGGGYHHLAIYKEGHQVANWLNTIGVTAFVLKYRLNRDSALEDAKRSVRLIRSRAAEWGIDPHKLGVMGFSAGGHLIINLTINADDGSSEASDDVERMSSRPDFMVPVYVSIRGLDVQNGIGPESPPTFLVGASDDKVTAPSNSLDLYEALLAVGVPAELHLYERGGHGFGLAKSKGPLASWTVRCEDWLRLRGLIE